MTQDDLFGDDGLDPPLELEWVLCDGRRYRLTPTTFRGMPAVGITWENLTAPYARGVVGGYYNNDNDALAAIEQCEARRGASNGIRTKGAAGPPRLSE